MATADEVKNFASTTIHTYLGYATGTDRKSVV